MKDAIFKALLLAFYTLGRKIRDKDNSYRIPNLGIVERVAPVMTKPYLQGAQIGTFNGTGDTVGFTTCQVFNRLGVLHAVTDLSTVDFRIHSAQFIVDKINDGRFALNSNFTIQDVQSLADYTAMGIVGLGTEGAPTITAANYTALYTPLIGADKLLEPNANIPYYSNAANDPDIQKLLVALKSMKIKYQDLGGQFNIPNI